MPDIPSLLRKLPKVDRILELAEARGLVRQHGHGAVTTAARTILDELRKRVRQVRAPLEQLEQAVDLEGILAKLGLRLQSESRPRLRRVINATGIILHTGLGRAVIAPAALAAIAEAHRGYSLLEVEAESGERSQREECVRDLLKSLTGAEAGTVVNNNAAAVMLCLTTLAKGREVIVSRGQLVEIGGGFRVPEVLAESGARLVEVGTTNRTYLADYERAITPETALLLRVHTSNYRIVGFAADVPLEGLVGLGKRRSLPVLDDLGSGTLIDLSARGIGDEPTVQQSVAAGADLVCFSGDKVLGGPQAGIIVGKRSMVQAVRRHPLFRALRVDKLTLTVLEATLRLYTNRERVLEDVPSLRMTTRLLADLDADAQALAGRLRTIEGLDVEIVDEASQLGGGSLPAHDLPTKCVSLATLRFKADALHDALRKNDPPIFARVKKDRLLLDVRTLLPGDDAEIGASLGAILRKSSPKSGPVRQSS